MIGPIGHIRPISNKNPGYNPGVFVSTGVSFQDRPRTMPFFRVFIMPQVSFFVDQSDPSQLARERM